MEIPTAISRFSYLWVKSLGPWLSVWAIRYKADSDYKLSSTARGMRWLVVALGYFLAASLPGPGIVRLIPGLIGLCFFCWPNFAYHLTNFFVRWPQTEGQVTHFALSDPHPIISYSYRLGGDTYGGRAVLKSNSNQYSEGQAITIMYDPLNPDQSKLAFNARLM
jgi:hypothetical protein